MQYQGLATYIQNLVDDEEASAMAKKWVEQFSSTVTCPSCHGQRLRPEALAFKIDGKNIAELSNLTLPELLEWSRHITSYVAPNL